MKIALYIEDGMEQIILTPETDVEKGIVGKMSDDSRELSIYRGSFYACRGGWTRWKQGYPVLGGVTSRECEDDSTIIVLLPKSKDES